MSIPSPKEGLKAKARVEIQQAVQLLKKNLNSEIFDPGGSEWKAIESSWRSLAKVVGQEQGKEVSQAGLKEIASAMGPKGMGGIMQQIAGAGAPGGGGAGGMPMGGPMPNVLGRM